MRVTSSLWVAAFIRRCHGAGAFAMVARRGAEEAGAILVMIDRLDGTADLYGQAPQSEVSETDDRLFQRLIDRQTAGEITARIARETKFDSDVWVVAVEDREGRSFLEAI